jgi:hypothetical protein
MKILNQYFKEVYYLRGYFVTLIIVLFLSYSVYLFFDEATVARIGDEDKFFEWLTSLSFLAGSVIFFFLSVKTRNIFFLLLSFALFFGFGEEISWGQRIFNFGTPDALYQINEQEEFNFHNIMTWEVNFMYKSFTILFGIILPFCVFHFKAIAKITSRIKLPVPPISIGIFFIIDWLAFRILLSYILPHGRIFKYYASDTEIYEFVTSFILLILSIYFLNNKNLITPGVDIKDQLNLNSTDSSVAPETKANLKNESIPGIKFKPSFSTIYSNIFKIK